MIVSAYLQCVPAVGCFGRVVGGFVYKLFRSENSCHLCFYPGFSLLCQSQAKIQHLDRFQSYDYARTEKKLQYGKNEKFSRGNEQACVYKRNMCAPAGWRDRWQHCPGGASDDDFSILNRYITGIYDFLPFLSKTRILISSRKINASQLSLSWSTFNNFPAKQHFPFQFSSRI